MGNELRSASVALAQDTVLQLFERTVLRAKRSVDNLEPYLFRNVLINFRAPTRVLKQAMSLEDTVATVGETGFLYISICNLTSNVQRIKEGTLLGTAAPVILVHKAIPQVAPDQQTENEDAANLFIKFMKE